MGPTSPKKIVLFLFVIAFIPVPIGIFMTGGLTQLNSLIDRVVKWRADVEYHEILESSDYRALENCRLEDSCILSSAELNSLREYKADLEKLERQK